MKFSLAQQAIGFIDLVAGKNKAVGKLIIVAQKGLAIAQTQINTEVAAMRAFAELGPIAGAAAAGTIRSLGTASIALIGATGIAQLAGASGGGTGIGGVSTDNTVASAPALPPTITDNANQGTIGTTNIIINAGGLVDEEALERIAMESIVPIIRNNIDNNDVILISAGSRNAQEIIDS